MITVGVCFLEFSLVGGMLVSLMWCLNGGGGGSDGGCLHRVSLWSGSMSQFDLGRGYVLRHKRL